MSNERLAKILFLGDAAVGKSSVIKRYVENTFSLHIQPTIGLAYSLKCYDNSDNSTTDRFSFWDISGDELEGVLNRTYYKDAVGAVIVYDASNTIEKSISNITLWLEDYLKKCSVEYPQVLFMANKTDLSNGTNILQQAHIDKILDKLKMAEINFLGQIEVSAQNGKGLIVNDELSPMLSKMIDAQQNPAAERAMSPDSNAAMSVTEATQNTTSVPDAIQKREIPVSLAYKHRYAIAAAAAATLCTAFLVTCVLTCGATAAAAAGFFAVCHVVGAFSLAASAGSVAGAAAAVGVAGAAGGAVVGAGLFALGSAVKEGLDKRHRIQSDPSADGDRKQFA